MFSCACHAEQVINCYQPSLSYCAAGQQRLSLLSGCTLIPQATLCPSSPASTLFPSPGIQHSALHLSEIRIRDKLKDIILSELGQVHNDKFHLVQTCRSRIDCLGLMIKADKYLPLLYHFYLHKKIPLSPALNSQQTLLIKIQALLLPRPHSNTDFSSYSHLHSSCHSPLVTSLDPVLSFSASQQFHTLPPPSSQHFLFSWLS